MSRGIEPVAPSATVQDAAIHMAEYDVGAVLVGTKETLEGVLTDRDIILRVVVDGRNPSEIAVADVMSSTLFSCKEDDAVEAVLTEMRERQIRRMPVMDNDGKPVGVVTLGDLTKAVPSPEQMRELLRNIAEPHRGGKETEAGKPETSGEGRPGEASAVGRG
ncbi:MAG TPA: CBS domain-containing protein [Propylenella sp.]